MIEPTDEMFQALLGRTAPRALDALLAIINRDQAQATEYTLSALPEGHDLATHFQIKVTYRGRGKWAVIWRSYCLGRDGKWDWESLPSNRTDEWLAGHRFELDEALRLARLKLPQIDIRGRTAADFLNDQDGRS